MSSTAEFPSVPAEVAPGDALAQLQLRVARRADVLARKAGRLPGVARRIWLRAEMEIFETVEAAEHAARRAA
jgi:hypothetical protein